MGCGASIACLDCKKLFYLGYGSYGSWISADSVEEFDSRAKRVRHPSDPPFDPDEEWTQNGGLKKNQNLRYVLSQHEGHRLRQWIDDYEYGIEGDTLYGMGSYGTRGAPIIEGISAYDRLNLWDNPPEEATAADAVGQTPNNPT